MSPLFNKPIPTIPAQTIRPRLQDRTVNTPAPAPTDPDLEFDATPLAVRKLLFFLFNQVRQLNSQPTVTLAQFRAFYRSLSSPQ